MILRVKDELTALTGGNPGKITVALSGGADSVALLHMLYTLKEELSFELCACHVNHNLRGEESDRDEAFVRDLCKKLDIPLTVKNIRVLDYIKKHESVEKCARDIRYGFFDEVCGGGYIATAHTASDNCETLLINIARGTALSGVCGIPRKRGNIIRPILSLTREEIEQYCKDNSLSYVTDSTNLSDDYTRNKIRHNVIPVLKEINPSLLTSITRLTRALSMDDEYLDNVARNSLEQAVLGDMYDVKKLMGLDYCILIRIGAIIFKENDIPLSTLALNSFVEIVRAGKGKINPCQYKFIGIRRKKLYVMTDTAKFRKNN